MNILGAYEDEKQVVMYCYMGDIEEGSLFWNDRDAFYEFRESDDLVYQGDGWEDTPVYPLFPQNYNVGDNVELVSGAKARIIAIAPILAPLVMDFEFLILEEAGVLRKVHGREFTIAPELKWDAHRSQE